MNEVMLSVITCQRAMMDHICKWLTVYGKIMHGITAVCDTETT